MPFIGAITGSKRERDCLVAAGRKLDLRCSGARPERAETYARSLVVDGCAGLLSIGLAGGLDPGLRPGHVVLSSTVIAPDGAKVPASEPWREALAADLDAADIPFRIGPIAGLDDLVRLAETRRALLSGTGAIAADMESHAVMRIAAASGLPFMAVRIVADIAGDDLPRAAEQALAPDGGISLAGLACGLLSRPGDLGGMLLLARRARKGFETLSRVAALPGLVQPL